MIYAKSQRIWNVRILLSDSSVGAKRQNYNRNYNTHTLFTLQDVIIKYPKTKTENILVFSFVEVNVPVGDFVGGSVLVGVSDGVREAVDERVPLGVSDNVGVLDGVDVGDSLGLDDGVALLVGDAEGVNVCVAVRLTVHVR